MVHKQLKFAKALQREVYRFNEIVRRVGQLLVQELIKVLFDEKNLIGVAVQRLQLLLTFEYHLLVVLQKTPPRSKSAIVLVRQNTRSQVGYLLDLREAGHAIPERLVEIVYRIDGLLVGKVQRGQVLVGDKVRLRRYLGKLREKLLIFCIG